MTGFGTNVLGFGSGGGPAPYTITYLVIAGGAGGGGGYAGGGGGEGAGGGRHHTHYCTRHGGVQQWETRWLSCHFLHPPGRMWMVSCDLE